MYSKLRQKGFPDIYDLVRDLSLLIVPHIGISIYLSMNLLTLPINLTVFQSITLSIYQLTNQ
jgi:hypothetical protein